MNIIYMYKYIYIYISTGYNSCDINGISIAISSGPTFGSAQARLGLLIPTTPRNNSLSSFKRYIIYNTNTYTAPHLPPHPVYLLRVSAHIHRQINTCIHTRIYILTNHERHARLRPCHARSDT